MPDSCRACECVHVCVCMHACVCAHLTAQQTQHGTSAPIAARLCTCHRSNAMFSNAMFSLLRARDLELPPGVLNTWVLQEDYKEPCSLCFLGPPCLFLFVRLGERHLWMSFPSRPANACLLLSYCGLAEVAMQIRQKDPRGTVEAQTRILLLPEFPQF